MTVFMFSVSSKRCNPEEISVAVATLRNGWLAPGQKALALESETAQRCGKKFGLLVNSHKSALMLSCIACGVGQGVDVLVPSLLPKYHLDILHELQATIHILDIAADTLTLSIESIPPSVSIVLLSNLLSIERKFDSLKDITVIEDLGANVVNTGSSVSIVSFDGLCSVAVFESQDVYNRALGCRDWGRVGDNDEDVNKRYDGWVLGKNVKYDNKFVYGHLGFNLKSCEIGAALALKRLQETPETVSCDPETEKVKVAKNGYTLIVDADDKQALMKKLGDEGFTATTLECRGFVVPEGDFPNGRRVLERSVTVVRSKDLGFPDIKHLQ